MKLPVCLSVTAAVALACGALAAAAGAAATVSSNWSGYAVQRAGAATFSSVSGTWIEPAATCSAGGETYVGVWVGLGGFSRSSKALEQIGTDADCTRRGRPAYSTWFELVPALPVSIRLATHPGDEMAASVTVRRRHATLRIRDLTTGSSYSTTRHLAAVDVSSAEWIVEAPSVCPTDTTCTTLPLTDFGTVSFPTATATSAGHVGTIGDPLFTATALELHENALALDAGRHTTAAAGTLFTATPSPLAAGGSFSVAWGATQAQAPEAPPEGPGTLNGTLRRPR